MKTRFSAVLPALAALITLACPPVYADGAGTARIDAVTLGVLDLTPDDGMAAGFTIDYLDTRLLAYSNTLNSGGSYTQNFVWPAPHTAGVAVLPASAGPGTAVASTNGGVGNVGAQAAAGTALGRDNYVGAESQQDLWLILAPHTVLTVAGDAFTRAQRTLGSGEGYNVFSWAAVSITDVEGTTSSNLTRDSTLYWDNPDTDAERFDHFMLAYANPGDTDLLVNLSFLAYTDVTVTTVAAAVPEPAAYALLLLGLLLVTTIARHQRRGQVTRRVRGCWP